MPAFAGMTNSNFVFACCEFTRLSLGTSALRRCSGWSVYRTTPLRELIRDRLLRRAQPTNTFVSFDKSERIQERQQLSFLRRRQRVVILRHACRLPAMTLDGILFGEGQAIVHQPIASSKRPQRSGSDLIGGCSIFRQRQNGYAVTRTDVVQQVIAVRMDDFVAERGRDREYTAVDFRPRARRGDGRRVANSAANLVKQRSACNHINRNWSPRRGLGGAHKVGEGDNIHTIVFGVSNWIIPRTVSDKAAIGGVLVRKQRRGDTHFVEVGVGGKRFKAGMLAFPAETADTSLASGLEHGNHDDRTAHGLGLFVANGKQRAICYGLYEAVAKGIRRDAESPDGIRGGDLLDDIGVSCARVDEGAP